MIDFENETLLEGLSISGKASIKAKAPAKPAVKVTAKPPAVHITAKVNSKPPVTPSVTAKLAAPLAKVAITPAVAVKAGTKLAASGHTAANVSAVLHAGATTPAEHKAVTVAMPKIAEAMKAAIKEAPKVLVSAPKVAATLATPSQILAAKAALSVPKLPALSITGIAKLAAPLAKVTVSPAVAELVGTKMAMQGHTAANVAAVLSAGAKTPAEVHAVKVALPNIAANVKEAALATSARVAALAKIPVATKINAAANVLAKAATNLAVKGKAPKPQHHETTKRKAHAVCAPVAKACGCQAKHHPHILRKARVKMAVAGYPAGTLDGMLANLHDMQDSLEKAALQRLATYEHNSLVSKHDFETAVLRKLANLACKLPKCSPTRVKAMGRIMGAL